MIDWQVKQTICGIKDLEDHRSSQITHLLSILDPDAADPTLYFGIAPQEYLTVRFHDVILPHPDLELPRREHIEQVLAFGRKLPQGDPAHLLIHCHMGISRSTAAAAAILAQAHTSLGEDAVFDEVQRLRPRAWPNSLMIRHADALLGREGRLVAALGRLYRRQLEANPRFADPLRTGGRLAEVEMAEAAG